MKVRAGGRAVNADVLVATGVHADDTARFSGRNLLGGVRGQLPTPFPVPWPERRRRVWGVLVLMVTDQGVRHAHVGPVVDTLVAIAPHGIVVGPVGLVQHDYEGLSANGPRWPLALWFDLSRVLWSRVPPGRSSR